MSFVYITLDSASGSIFDGFRRCDVGLDDLYRRLFQNSDFLKLAFSKVANYSVIIQSTHK